MLMNERSAGSLKTCSCEKPVASREEQGNVT